jgi:sphingolipid delta-4 desaturase
MTDTAIHAATDTTAFLVGPAEEPHAARTKAILKAHPEVRKLIGRNPWTAGLLVAHVAAQTAIAAAFGLAGLEWWWLALIVAWVAGAFLNHNLYVMVHEATHNLIFASRPANKVCAILADMPNVFPGAINFRAFHLKHHTDQGDHALDADLPSEWEARLIGHSAFGKALWLFLFPVFQVLRVRRVHGVMPVDRWAVANLAANLVFLAVLLLATGPLALIYLFASFWFAIGPHPLGARWIQEHFTLDADQETASYYGPMNRFAMNIGHHVEHHDFPSIPWNRLPELKRLAPEFYEPLASHRSWTRLLLRFLLDGRYSLHSRVVRAPA